MRVERPQIALGLHADHTGAVERREHPTTINTVPTTSPSGLRRLSLITLASSLITLTSQVPEQLDHHVVSSALVNARKSAATPSPSAVPASLTGWLRMSHIATPDKKALPMAIVHR
jgi:hypothetical protein